MSGILKNIHSRFFCQLEIIILILGIFSSNEAEATDHNIRSSLQETYAAIAEKAMPAVLTVYSLRYNGNRLQENGIGSGFLISDDGYIVTNYHVIQDANSLMVKLFDGKVAQAKIVGVSQRTDLAVLKISAATRLPFLKFEDTHNVKIGHHAIAIGSPFALSQTMTTGIVSYKGRELGLHYEEDYIQTDAAINLGNSGGSLLNIQGDVIGINDCLIAPQNKSSGNVGIGFAIDGNLARIVVLSIIKSQFPQKPFIGIRMREFGKKSPPIISEILKQSPAASSDLLAGDFILKIDNKKVSSVWDFQTTILALYSPGDEVFFTFLRNNKEMCTKVKIGEIK